MRTDRQTPAPTLRATASVQFSFCNKIPEISKLKGRWLILPEVFEGSAWLVGVIAFGTLMSQDITVGMSGRGKKLDRSPTGRQMGKGAISKSQRQQMLSFFLTLQTWDRGLVGLSSASHLSPLLNYVHLQLWAYLFLFLSLTGPIWNRWGNLSWARKKHLKPHLSKGKASLIYRDYPFPWALLFVKFITCCCLLYLRFLLPFYSLIGIEKKPYQDFLGNNRHFSPNGSPKVKK